MKVFSKKKFALTLTCLPKQLHTNYHVVYIILFTTPFIFVKQWQILVISNYGKANLIIRPLQKMKYKIEH